MQELQHELFHQKLLNIRSEILNSSLFHGAPEEIKTSKGDEADQAASEINMSLALRLRERDQLLVQKIDHALAKISAGDFGHCEGCDAEIENKRLTARPYTTLCIARKEEQEHQKRFFA